MFLVSEEERTAVRDAFANHGEAAAIQALLRFAPGLAGHVDLPLIVASIAQMPPKEEIEQRVAEAKRMIREGRKKK
jgi:hypothetical protein